MRVLLWSSVAALLIGGSALTPTPAKPSPARFEPAPCTGDFTGVPQKVECGILTVDETRGSPHSRRVALPVAIVRALHPRPDQPPVIYLHGGPGGSAIQGLPALLRGPEGRELIGQDQDWIFFDQRGARLSSPELDCGEAPLNDAGPLSDAAARTLEACGQRHAAAGVDLSRYNSAEVARDVQDLRHALNIPRFDLFGVSYGTRVGFSVLTHAPQGVRAVVLDSVWPPEATWAEGGPQMVSNAVKLIFSRCAADPDCHARFPDPTSELNGLAQDLLTAPKTVGARTYTADDLGGFLMDTVYDPEGARSLPRDVDAMAHGNYAALDAEISARSEYTEAQHLTFLCKEEFPFEHRERVALGTENDAVSRLTVASFQRYFDVCRSFPVGPADPIEQKPVYSRVPTLFLSAEIDPGCPPPLAQAAARRFVNSRFVLVPNTTHGVIRNSSCGRKLIRAYLGDPSAPLDTSCLHPEHDRFVFALR